MTENKRLDFSVLVATAKTSEEIQAWVMNPLEWRQGPLNTTFDGPYDIKLSENRRKEKWVSLGLVLRLREQQEEKEASLRKRLEEEVEFMILGKVPEDPETDYTKGYSKGYYNAKDQIKEILKEVFSAGFSSEKSAEGLREVLGSGKEGDEK